MDKKIILAKIDEIDGYLEELDSLKPIELEDYINSIKDKRTCERLLQISIESVLDICNVLITELKLGLPADEEAVFDKLKDKGIITKGMAVILKEMKGFRNILVHKYGIVDNELVFENLSNLQDFDKFKEEILNSLKNYSNNKK